MIAAVAFAVVLGASALALVVLPLRLPASSAWLEAQADLWFAREEARPGGRATRTLALDAAEDLRTGKLDRHEYGLLVEDERPSEDGR